MIIKNNFLLGLLLGMGSISSAWLLSPTFSNQAKIDKSAQLYFDEVSAKTLEPLIQAEVKKQINFLKDKQMELVKNMVHLENLKTSYKPYIILARSGFQRREEAPNLDSLEKMEDKALPEEYEIYMEFFDGGMPSNIYVMIKEPALMGDIMVGGIEEVWYGPFN